MRVRIRAGHIRLWMPIPLSLVGFAIRVAPQAAFEEMRRELQAPYNELMTKEYVYFIYQECREFLDHCRGLEIVHVEAHDGTFVSIIV